MTKTKDTSGKNQQTLNEKESFKSLSSLPDKGKGYLYVVFALGATIYTIHQPSLESQDFWFALILGILSGIVGSKQVIDPNSKVLFSAETVVLGIAYLAGGLPTLLFSSLISTVIQSVLIKKAWYVWFFNLFQVAINFLVMHTIIKWVSDVIPSQFSYNIIALLIGFVFSSIVHTALVATVIYLVNGIPIRKSTTFTSLAIFRETCFYCIALSTVIIWEIEPLAILITLSPVYMLYSSFHLPFLKAKSEMDQKTGLLNANTFRETLKSELERAHRYKRPLTLVMADLDYMRHVNNVHGHLAGDKVLIEVGKTLKKVFREFDTVARFGGEEFAVILPETSREDVIHVVERARVAIQDMSITVETSDEPLLITMSFGIAQRDNDVQTTNDLIQNADMALYHAKGSGRNGIGIYKDSKVLCVTMPFTIPIEHEIAG